MNKKLNKKAIKIISEMPTGIYNCVICHTINMSRTEAYQHPCRGFRLSLGLKIIKRHC